MKKRLLFLSWKLPYPLISGAEIRIFNNLRILSNEYDIDMLVVTNEKIEKKNIEFLKKYCKNIKIKKMSKFEVAINLLKGLINQLPFQVNYYSNPVKEFKINLNLYDKIFYNHIRTCKYIEKEYKEKNIVDFVDAISLNLSKSEKNIKGIQKKIIYKIEKNRVLKYEKNIYKKINKILIISKNDRDYLKSIGIKIPITIVGNFVTLEYDIERYRDKNLKKTNYILFLGKMNYEPNIIAVEYFAKEVFPKIREKYPNLEFWIAGNCPVKRVTNLKRIKGIKVLGYVESREKVMKESKLIVAPMLTGTGVQNKILEAMSLEKTVVTTPAGILGMESLIGNEIIVAESTEKMVKEIIEVLSSRHLYEIGKNAKKYIEKNYSYNRVYNDMLNALK